MNKVYIVIVNYLKYADTIECLESVLKSDYTNFQILLIDNSPNDLSEQNLVKWFNNNYKEVPTLFDELIYPLIDTKVSHVITSEKEFVLSNKIYNEKIILIKALNQGFASANLGLQYILKDNDPNSLIWILNNDTVVEKNALSELVSFYNNSKSKTGIIGNKIFYYHNRNELNGIGGRYDKWLGISSHVGESELDKHQFDDIDYNNTADYVIGASMFISKEFLLDVGQLNEAYFLFFEEIDWVQRSKKKGWELGFASKSILYHKESASISPGSASSILFETSFLSSKLIFTFKYHKLALPIIYLTIVWMVFNRVRRRQFDKVMPLIKVAINPFAFKKYITRKMNNIVKN